MRVKMWMITDRQLNNNTNMVDAWQQTLRHTHTHTHTHTPHVTSIYFCWKNEWVNEWMNEWMNHPTLSFSYSDFKSSCLLLTPRLTHSFIHSSTSHLWNHGNTDLNAPCIAWSQRVCRQLRLHCKIPQHSRYNSLQYILLSVSGNSYRIKDHNLQASSTAKPEKRIIFVQVWITHHM